MFLLCSHLSMPKNPQAALHHLSVGRRTGTRERIRPRGSLDTYVAGLPRLPAGEGRAWYGRQAMFRPREMVEKFEGRLAVVANAKENAEFAFWIGSGISRQTPNIDILVERAVDYKRERAVNPATAAADMAALEGSPTLAEVKPAKVQPQFTQPRANW
jgi:hypothetical protein